MGEREASYYLNEGMNLKARFFDATIIFFHSITLIIHGKKAFLSSIFSLKYWRHPCFHDVLNLFHIVFSFLNSLFQITNTVGDLIDIIPNACSPKETELIEIADGDIAKGLVAMKDRDLIPMGFIRLFCTGCFIILSLFLPSCIIKPTLSITPIMEDKK